MKELMGLFKNSFGKEKNNRTHAIVMLVIYGIFMLTMIVIVRTTPIKEDKKEINDNSNKQEDIINSDINNEIDNKNSKNSVKKNYDVNYSYSYTITFDGEKEIYLGKRVDDKEKFSYIKNGTTYEYAILNDNYLVLENGIYHITDILDTYFRYCNVDRIINILEKSEHVEENNKYIYDMTNASIFNMLSDTIKNDNNGLNRIELMHSNESLKEINMNLDNYVSSVLGNSHTLNIKMEFANVGTTEDFEIKVG